LIEVEHVEETGPFGRLDLVVLQFLLARVGVVPPDLESDVHAFS
jgi:hypothetical protein